MAQYFKRHKPRSKIVIFDANRDLVSKKDLFLSVWKNLYPGLIEYRPNSDLLAFDASRNVAQFKDEKDFKADLFNVVPQQQAGRVANPLINVNEQWIAVDYRSMEAVDNPGVHVIGDATWPAPQMPKSALMANNHAKVAADAVVAQLTGRAVNDHPIIANTCYSYVDDRQAMHVSSVHKWNADRSELVRVPGAGGLSTAPSELEGVFATFFARNMWYDALG